ncbi:unnamed protein product, partial [Didymodactylos carnosus]
MDTKSPLGQEKCTVFSTTFVLHLQVYYPINYEFHGALANVIRFGEEELIEYVTSNRN